MGDFTDRDQELVQAAASGDEVALSRVLDRWLPVTLGWCRRLAGPKVDPEDAAHDAMLVVLRRLPGLRRPDAFPSWLYGIVRRTIAGHRRRAWVRHWSPGADPGDRADDAAGPGRSCELGERARDVQAALEQLPQRLREILVLCEVEDLTDEEAADLLGIPVGTAKSRLRHARQRFAAAAVRRHIEVTGSRPRPR